MSAYAQLWRSLADAGRPAPYLLIDCAGLEGGRAEIPEAPFDQVECLFTGDLSRELADVGPYLARLRSLDKAVTDVAEELLLAHVGTIAILQDQPVRPPGFSDLHRHFRKMNVVYGPEGQPLFFRYYDPRVILDVLRVLEPAQLDAFFGPLESLVFADAEGGLVRCFRRNGQLQVSASGGGAA